MLSRVLQGLLMSIFAHNVYAVDPTDTLMDAGKFLLG